MSDNAVKTTIQTGIVSFIIMCSGFWILYAIDKAFARTAIIVALPLYLIIFVFRLLHARRL